MRDPVLSELRVAVATYTMPQAAKEAVTASNLLVVCGITAAGKNSVMEKIIASGSYEHVITHTTRQPRSKEKDGIDHWFVNNEKMLALIKEKSFVEIQFIHGDYCYGTTISALTAVSQHGKKPVLELNVDGIAAITEAVPTLQPIFILPPSYDIWMERLGTRDQMSDGEKERRLHSAKLEIETALRNRSFSFVINHEADFTVKNILSGQESDNTAQHKAREFAEDLHEYLLAL